MARQVYTTKRLIRNLPRIALLLAVGFMLLYPLAWLFLSTFKSSTEIFASSSFFPKRFSLEGYRAGWKGTGQFTFGHFLLNSFLLVGPTTIGTLITSILVAYGFARFDFRMHKILLTVMIATMMLPNAVIVVPRYILFNELGWIRNNPYLCFIVPAFTGTYPFFTFLMIQFFRQLPRELDESALIDGCNSWRILMQILLPLAKSPIMVVIVFQFMWTWNDFFNSLIFITSVAKYPVSLGLRIALDSSSKTNWSAILAMAVVSVIPIVILFASTQRLVVEGIATQGLKS